MEYNEIKENFEEAKKTWEDYKTKVEKNWDYALPYSSFTKKLYESDEYKNYEYWCDRFFYNKAK